MVTHTYTAGVYKAEVTDDNYAIVYKNDIMIDKPGPWGTHEGARQWAELIVGKLHVDDGN